MGHELRELVVVESEDLQAHQCLDVRVDALQFVVAQVKLLQAREVLAEIAIKLC